MASTNVSNAALVTINNAKMSGASAAYDSLLQQQAQQAGSMQYRWATEYSPLFTISPEYFDNNRYKNRNLKEYSTPEFHKIKDILPKDIAPHAVLCPKEDIKSRIESYLTNPN